MVCYSVFITADETITAKLSAHNRKLFTAYMHPVRSNPKNHFDNYAKNVCETTKQACSIEYTKYRELFPSCYWLGHNIRTPSDCLMVSFIMRLCNKFNGVIERAYTFYFSALSYMSARVFFSIRYPLFFRCFPCIQRIPSIEIIILHRIFLD